MSYNPLIEIKTESDEDILYCEFSSPNTNIEGELFKTIGSMVKQGLAFYQKGSRYDCYPAFLSVPKVNDSVKDLLLPIAERIVACDSAACAARFHYKRTKNDEDPKEHEEWKERLERIEQRNSAGLAAIKAYSSDDGLIIKVWGTL